LAGVCQLSIFSSLALGALAPASAAQSVQTPITDEPILVSVEFEGLVTYKKPSIMRALGLEIGKHVQPLDVRNAFEAFGLYTKLGVFEYVEGGVRLTLPVVELPSDIEPRFIGNDSFSLSKIVEWAGIGDRDFIYVHEADLVVARLNNAYRAQGFHFVEVRWVPGPSTPGQPVNDVIFQVIEGPKVRCIGLDLVGNDTLPDSGFWIWKGGLRRVAGVKTTGRGVLSWFGRPFVEEELQADLQAMRQAYRDRGYLDVRVQVDHYDFNDLRNRVKVHVVVDEGALWTVGSINLQSFAGSPGNAFEESGPLESVALAFPEQELRDLFELKVGEAYEASRVSHDARAITEHYGVAGYLAAYLYEDPDSSGGFNLLPSEKLWDVENRQVHLTYRIVQGHKRRLRELSLEGNENTRDRILRREVLVLPGEIVDQEKLVRAQRRLTNTSYFSDPRDPTHPQPSFVLRNVDGNPDLVDVHFTVQQGTVVNATLSGGATSDGGLLGIVQVTADNFDISTPPSSITSAFGEIFDKRAFHGAGQRFSMRASPGSEIDSWSAGFSEPDAFRSHFNRSGWGFNASGRDRVWRSHDESRNRFHVYLSHLFEEADTSVQIGPVTQSVKIRNLDPDDALPRTLIASEGELDFLGLQLDLRVNKLDNRQYPREGSSTRWSTTAFGGVLGEDVDMIKSEVHHDYYWLLGESEEDIRSGMYTGFHVGVSDAYGDTPFVPYSERFFLGGSSRLRGFRFRRVGPNDGKYSLGGETVISGTLEYRRTLFSSPLAGTTRRQEIFRGGPFLDFGVLGVDAWDLDLDDMRASVGISLGLTSPIPLVFNFGWPLMDGEGDDLQVFSFRVSLR
jgi:outer membrane protein insertion porin family